MTPSKEQLECFGHDWDEWDELNNRSETQCQVCHITLIEWVEYLETLVDSKEELLQALKNKVNYFKIIKIESHKDHLYGLDTEGNLWELVSKERYPQQETIGLYAWEKVKVLEFRET